MKSVRWNRSPHRCAPRRRIPTSLDVLDASGKTIAIATRTSPVSDAIVGYKGPTDTLMLLDAEGKTLRAIRVRKSYETKAYLGYVTDDAYFMRLFNGKTLEQLAGIDFEKEKIEGVSGATITSWSIAESLKKRSEKMLAENSSKTAWLKQIRWRWQDTGHALVILSAFLMAFTALRGSKLARNLHHLLLVVYAGFIVGEMLSQALFVGWATARRTVAERARPRAARRRRAARARVQPQAALLPSHLPARRAAAVAHAPHQMAVVATALALRSFWKNCRSRCCSSSSSPASPASRSISMPSSHSTPGSSKCPAGPPSSSPSSACSSPSSPPWPTAATAAPRSLVQAPALQR